MLYWKTGCCPGGKFHLGVRVRIISEGTAPQQAVVTFVPFVAQTTL